MNPLLIALLAVLLGPLFVGTWRTSLWGLSMQGLLMAWLALRLGPHPSTPSAWLTLIDLALLRGVAAPTALYQVLRARNVPARHDAIPPNLLSWTLALGSVLVAFNFAQVLVPAPAMEQSIVSVAATGLMLGFLVLATQSATFGQMIAVLRIENAIALFELSGEGHAQSVAIQVGQMLVVAASIVLYRWYLNTVDDPDAPLGDDASEVAL